MPDLDQLLDTLVADVTAGTRAPGAPAAIKQARRRRAAVAVAAVGAVAFIAVGGGLAAGTLGGSDQPSPIEEPTSPSPTTAQESAEPTPTSLGELTRLLDAILAQAPDWAISETFPDGYDYAFSGPCSGSPDDWGKGATSGGDGGIGEAGFGVLGFPSKAQASDAAARLVESLDSCTSTAWQTQPIVGTGAVFASTDEAVTWIKQIGTVVRVLQIPTTDGPPPGMVQAEVAGWMDAYQKWQEQN